MAIRNALPFEFPYRWPDLRRFFGKVSDEAADFLDQRDRDLEDFLAGLGGGGGVPSLFVAASDATDRSKEYADYVCDGTDDDVEVNAALATLIYGGLVVLSEGSFYWEDDIIMGAARSLRAMGAGATYVNTNGTTGISGLNQGSVTDLSLIGPSGSGTIGVDITGSDATVARCLLDDFADRIVVGDFNARIDDCRFNSGTSARDVVLNDGLAWVRGNYFANVVEVNTTSGYNRIEGNHSDETGTAIDIVAGDYTVVDRNFLPNGAASFSDSGTFTNLGTNFSNAGPW